MITKKRALNESEVFPEDYGLTKRSKYTREIHMLRLGRMIEQSEQAGGNSFLPWEHLCGMCPACVNFGTWSSIDDMWDSTIYEICTICREFVGLPKEESVRNIPCPCHKLSAEGAYHKTKEVL